MNLYTADNGMRLGPGGTIGTLELLYGFTFVPESGNPDGAGSDSVTATFSSGSTQNQIRTAVRNAMKAWATARGDTIVAHLLSDLTIVVP